MTKRISLSALCNHKIFIYFVRIAAWMAFFIISYIGLSNENLWYHCPLLSLAFCLSMPLTHFKMNYDNIPFPKWFIRFLLEWAIFFLCIFIIYEISIYFPFKL